MKHDYDTWSYGWASIISNLNNKKRPYYTTYRITTPWRLLRSPFTRITVYSSPAEFEPSELMSGENNNTKCESNLTRAASRSWIVWNCQPLHLSFYRDFLALVSSSFHNYLGGTAIMRRKRFRARSALLTHWGLCPAGWVPPSPV